MILTDTTIREVLASGRLVVEPYEDSNVQPSSIDLRLASKFRVFANHSAESINLRAEQPELTREIDVGDDGEFVLHPGEFVLAATIETITLPNDLVGRLEGRSSLGRIGLLVHSTAGFVDPGWHGQLTLELTNVATLPIQLFSSMRIAQLSLLQTTAPATRPYGSDGLQSKYQGQSGPTPSRFFRELDGST